MLRDLLRRIFRDPKPHTGPASVQQQSLTLHEFNSVQATPLEEMLGVDGLTPACPHLPTAIPGELEMQLWISGYLQQCPEMFDEGTLDFFGPYLRAQEQLWMRASEVAERSAQNMAHRIRSANAEHLQVARTRLAQLEQERSDTARSLAELQTRLHPEGLYT